MRLFIAINFNEQIKDKLQNIISKIKESAIQGKFVSNEHMHLTLEFLGEIEPKNVEHIIDALNQLSSNPFTMHLSGIGNFKRKEGNIYWIGINKNDSLLKIQHQLHNALIDKGFKLESRDYKPHLTIGRKIKLEENFDGSDFNQDLENIEIKVSKIDLMKSENIKGKLVYSIVYSKVL